VITETSALTRKPGHRNDEGAAGESLNKSWKRKLPQPKKAVRKLSFLVSAGPVWQARPSQIGNIVLNPRFSGRLVCFGRSAKLNGLACTALWRVVRRSVVRTPREQPSCRTVPTFLRARPGVQSNSAVQIDHQADPT
jgi:hypothetical protein